MTIILNNQKYETVNPFILFIFFIVSVIVALPLRVFQLMTNIQPDTGFWVNAAHFSIPILYAVLALGTVLPILVSLLHKNGLGKTEDQGEKKVVGGVISFLTAGGLAVNAITRYSAFSDLYFAYSTTAQSTTLMSYLSKSGATAMGLEAFFAVVSAIFFIMLAIALLTGKDPSEYKLLAIMPVFWTIFRIMHRFMRKISFLNVSELFLELLMIVFLMMFFMAYAQVTAKVNAQGLEWKLFAYGLPAALFCLVCFVPRLVVTILGHGERIAADSSIEVVDLTMAAFVLYALVDRSKVFRQAIRSKKEDAE